MCFSRSPGGRKSQNRRLRAGVAVLAGLPLSEVKGKILPAGVAAGILGLWPHQPDLRDRRHPASPRSSRGPLLCVCKAPSAAPPSLGHPWLRQRAPDDAGPSPISRSLTYPHLQSPFFVRASRFRGLGREGLSGRGEHSQPPLCVPPWDRTGEGRALRATGRIGCDEHVNWQPRSHSANLLGEGVGAREGRGAGNYSEARNRFWSSTPAVAFNPPLFTISLPSGGLVPRHGHCSPPSPPWMGGGRAAWRMTHVLSV